MAMTLVIMQFFVQFDDSILDEYLMYMDDTCEVLYNGAEFFVKYMGTTNRLVVDFDVYAIYR